MAITSSAKRAIRSSGRKRVFNIRRKKAVHDASKALERALATGDKTAAAKLLPAGYRAIDKATKRGVLKANTAARKKSRLARLVAAK